MSSGAPNPSDRWRFGRAAAWGAGCVLSIYSFWEARELNSGYSMPTNGTWSVPELEQVVYVWFAMCGSLAIVCLAQCLTELGVASRLSKAMDAARTRPGAFIACIALFAFAASLLFRRLILLDQPVTDDEGTYRFIAQTLLTGHVTNPLPDDPEFFKNQFVILNAHGWHGKYPIGHPLVLALGEAIGLVDVVPPIVGALCVWLSYRVGSKLFDSRVAIAGAALLLVSPHFVWTCGTLLSQPTLCLVLMAGMLLVLNDAERPRTKNVLLAGFAFGFGILVRPLPGGLFALVATAQLALDARKRGESWGRCLLRSTLFGAAAAAWVLVFAGVNYAQSGNAFRSGYHEVHHGLGLLSNRGGRIVNSVFASLLRENFWLLAWPFGLVLLPWCRPLRAPVLFWGMLGSQIAYRVIAPKTVVSVTGPIYFTEVVPLLTLAAADALSRLGTQFSSARVRPSVVALAATVVGAATFVPIQLSAVAVGAATRRVAYDQLEETGAERALVFANAMISPESAVSWAYYPDNPSPRFDDRWLFVRVPNVPEPRPAMFDFWRRHFPDRRAFIFAMSKHGPHFQELGD